MHKSGFVNIIGKPNVGKSTLMNALTGERLSIITHKAQTTRHRIIGIVNGEGYQIVFSDTPGIINPHYKLHERMMQAVNATFNDGDIILFLTDIKEKPDELRNDKIILKLQKSTIPILFVINKIDLINQEAQSAMLLQFQNILPAKETITISALQKKNTDKITESILKYLPEHPPYYAENELTNRSERFFVSEIIREKIFLFYQQEIPYSTEVTIDTFSDEAKIVKIRAVIYVDRESQQPILIGKKGSALKKIGTMARQDIEKFLKKKVFLETYVKVKEHWRDNEDVLKKFGY